MMHSTTSAGDATTAATAVAPLTTKFNPANSCLADLYLEVTTLAGQASLPGGYSWIHVGPTTSTSACVPSGWAPNAYFSPGICPEQYTLGCDASTHTIGSSITEYRATCCPTGYACRASMDFTMYPWASIDPCTVKESDLTWTTAMVTYNTEAENPATIDISVTNYYQALGVSIRWQPSDLPIKTDAPTSSLTTAPSTASGTGTTSLSDSSLSSTSTTTTTKLSHSIPTTQSSSPTTTASPISSQTISSLPSSEASSSSNGLSTGAKAGVGVGVAVAGILIIFAAIFFFYIRPRRNNKNMSQAWNGAKKTELDGTAAEPVNASHELGSSALNELDGNSRKVHELDGGWKR